MKYKLSKKIVHKLINKEIKETKVNVNIETLTKYENIYTIIKKELKKSLENDNLTLLITIDEIIKDLKKDCFAEYNQYDNSLKICLSTIKRLTFNQEDYLWNLIISIYHEYKHTLVYHELKNNERFKIDNLHNFYLLTDYLIDEISNYYDIKPENFYEEIIADYYANEKTIEFINNYPKLKKKLQLYILKDKIYNEINYQNYDVQRFINIISKLIKYSYKNNEFSDEFPYPYNIIKILYDKFGNYKSLNDLNSNKDWNSYPKEVQYLIISSKTYLDSINYKNLTLEELNFIEEAIEYTYTLELQRKQNNEKTKNKINIMHKKLDNAKIKDKEYYYCDDLLYVLKSKEKYNNQKLEYLDYQRTKIIRLTHDIKTKIKKQEYS